MADPSNSLILDALHLAVTQPSGLPLFGTPRSPGLFASSAAAKKAAQRAQDEALLHVVRSISKGKSPREIWAITDKGVAFLKGTAEQILAQLGHRNGTSSPLPLDQSAATKNGSETCVSALLAHLARWQFSQPTHDCPLPDLFVAGRQACAALTLGQFHDELRSLHAQERVYLHPWTGPLSEIPEPPCALLIGHEIAYYASLP